MSLDGKISHSASVSVPSSGKCIPCSDSDDILEYLQDYDYKPIINNLRKAGVDTELVDIIEEGLEDAMDELFY
jgi:hypothetical protein